MGQPLVGCSSLDQVREAFHKQVIILFGENLREGYVFGTRSLIYLMLFGLAPGEGSIAKTFRRL